MEAFSIRAPDDWHCHLRDGAVLSRMVADQSRYFMRSMVMPNLVSPILTVGDAQAYYKRIMKQIPQENQWQPCMTLYLTESMDAETIRAAKQSDCVLAVKLYPAGATTRSEFGISNLSRIDPILSVMEEVDLPLLVHGEVVDEQCDIFDREARFIDQYLEPLVRKFPRLRIVLEHITTEAAVQFVCASSKNVAATITPQHLLLNRNDLLVGGVKPHYYCLPVLKRSRDQQALVEAATSGKSCFFLGTDSAPHPVNAKESACGCAGVYSAHAAIELYATVFEQHHALDRLEDFASHFGARFYQLPLNDRKITLTKEPWEVPEKLSFGSEQLVPLFAGKQIGWSIKMIGSDNYQHQRKGKESVSEC
ncbi:MAG: dihydroorotase [Coxiellaceae bacterium]|nr:dihydroorotase [Coxiellaceae bacterium]